MTASNEIQTLDETKRERQAKQRTGREFQKTCGCKTIAVSEFDLDSANWILCDYHKGKVQTKK